MSNAAIEQVHHGSSSTFSCLAEYVRCSKQGTKQAAKHEG